MVVPRSKGWYGKTNECFVSTRSVSYTHLDVYKRQAVTSIMLNSFPKYETRDLPGLKTYLERKGELPKGLVLGLVFIFLNLSCKDMK